MNEICTGLTCVQMYHVIYVSLCNQCPIPGCLASAAAEGDGVGGGSRLWSESSHQFLEDLDLLLI